MSVPVRVDSSGRVVGGRSVCPDGSLRFGTGEQLRPKAAGAATPESAGPDRAARRQSPRRKITQVYGRPEPQGLPADRAARIPEAQASTPHFFKSKMRIMDRYHWRPIGSNRGARCVKLTLECGCKVKRWQSQEPATWARCEKRPR